MTEVRARFRTINSPHGNTDDRVLGARRRAMTLIETLATVAILSLAAMALLWRAGSTLDGSIHVAAAAARSTDAQARAAALANGPIELAIAEDQTAIRIRTLADEHLIGSAAINKNLTVKLLIDGVSKDRVVFDAAGRSVDYTIELRSETAVRRWRVSGLTGWIEQERVSQ
jgi:prepilin-type N-terminal cleavage/methylation domain-containing protein